MNSKRVYFKDLIKKQINSGKSINAFCRDNGVSDGQFHYWKQKINSPQGEVVKSNDKNISLAPITILNDNVLVDNATELIYPNGVILKLHHIPSAKELISFITLLD